MLTEDLTRTQIVQYAGASGDYNPLHTDDKFTKEIAGYPGVFAHGMLTMGMTGRVLTDWFGAEGLLSYGVRFVKQVFPGDALDRDRDRHVGERWRRRAHRRDREPGRRARRHRHGEGPRRVTHQSS